MKQSKLIQQHVLIKGSNFQGLTVGPLGNSGFTLIELMVAIALSAIVLAGIYGAYFSQVKSYTTQRAVAELQQNIRNAMYYMQDSIRLAGLDPLDSGLMGFVANFNAPYDAIGATTDANNIALTVDADEDGVLDSNAAELIAYRLDNATSSLQKLFIDPVTMAPSWETIAENVDALDFVYLDGADPPNVLAPPVDPTQIRSVQVTVVARNRETPVGMTTATTDNHIYRNQQGAVIFNPGGDNFRRNYLTLHIICRNLSL